MRRWLVLAALTTATPAWAQADEPRFCPNRPSIGASACTTDPGRVLVELSAADWQRQDDAGVRVDSVLFGDFQVRVGAGPSTEVQLSWTPLAYARERDRATGATSAATGVGDVRLGVRQNLRNPDGSGLSIAAEPYVLLPAGREPLGAGDWSAGVVLPVTYQLSESWDFGVTGELAAAVDADGDGRHAAYDVTFGLSRALTERWSVIAEAQVGRDEDPAGRSTLAVAAASLVYLPRPGLQFDLFAAAGLNRASPDFRFLTGAAILF